MSEQLVPNPMEVASLIQKLVSLLASVDSETRRRATHAAMVALGDSVPPNGTPSVDKVPDDDLDLGQFFQRDDDLKPADNAYLCAAYHFAKFGNAAFNLEDIRSIARETGVTIPDRLDMTFKQAGGKRKLFQVAGKNEFRPTAAAGLYFKERWTVKPGKAAKVPS